MASALFDNSIIHTVSVGMGAENSRLLLSSTITGNLGKRVHQASLKATELTDHRIMVAHIRVTVRRMGL